MSNFAIVLQTGLGALAWQSAYAIVNRSDNPNLKALARISLIASLLLATIKAAKTEDSFANRFSRGFAGMAAVEFTVAMFKHVYAGFSSSAESTVGKAFLF